MIIDLVVADDWQGLYIGGILAEEGHKIQTDDLLEHIKQHVAMCDGISDFEYVVLHVNQEWMEDQGSLPQFIKDIPEYVIEL
jgi:hypothetical protein